MTFLRRSGGEIGEVEALITDRYLDSLLAIQPRTKQSGTARDPAPSEDTVGAAVRAISRRLATDLPRFHPSFRFEERLALRLAEVAASMHLPVAAGGENQSLAVRRIPITPSATASDPMGYAGSVLDDRGDSRPYLIGGAVAASALSLAGAWFAWRRRTSPMARAVRAAHQLRPGT
ncbi:MAG TPA: hypothetical protein VM451_00665 [Candidatus Limnocylindria bacterium]|nr:hypothetical protein [Candidatus Limnocylindria bacterium]